MLFPSFLAAVGPASARLELAHLQAQQRLHAAPLHVRVQTPGLYLAGGAVSCASAGGCHVLLAGSPRWPGQNDPAAALLAAWQAQGAAALSGLRGAFAAVVIDQQQGSTCLALDRVGQMRMLYGWHEGTLWIASDLPLWQAASGKAPRIDSQALFEYFYFHAIPSPDSIYHGVHKVPPGMCVQISAQQEKTSPLRAARFVPSNAPLPDQAGAALHHTLASAVARLPEVQTAGAFLSGGLDSSTTVGLMARQRQQAGQAKVATFTIGFDAPEYDESAYAEITARHFGSDHHVLRLQPQQVAEALPSMAAFMEEPFGNSSILPTYFCAQHARQHGITQMIAGDGGDELFAGNERYAKQGVFEFYHRLPRALRALLLDAPLAVLPAGLPLIRKANSYVQQARIPLPDRLQTYNFLHRFPLEDLFTGEFLRTVEPQRPLQMLRQRYQECEADNSVDRMLYLDWKFTLADNDLVKVNQACQLAGVGVHYPLLDDEVVDFSMQIAAQEKLKGQRLRHFYKESMRGFLHDDTLSKKKHGFGLPFGLWLRTDPELRHLAQTALQALKTRDIVRADFIERARQEHASGHASYFGELVWLLMMLELWLQHHG